MQYTGIQGDDETLDLSTEKNVSVPLMDEYGAISHLLKSPETIILH